MKTKIVNIIYSLSLLLFIIAFNFKHNPSSGWYQQFLPSLSNMQVSDIFFLDSLTGWAVTGNGEPNDTSGYILKTIDGGDNWSLKLTDFRDFSRVKFLNENTGFVSGGYGNGARLYKSTDGGENWFNLNIPGGGQIYFNDMSVLSEDTIWVVASNSLVGGVFRTTNGGISWKQQYSAGSSNPNKIYFYDADLGFISNESTSYLRKTTNGGINWEVISGATGFTDLQFINVSTGWKARGGGGIEKTTNGGLNWFAQPLPQLNWVNSALKIKAIDGDTLWAVGGVIQWIPSTSNFRGVVYKTTNGGENWGYQIPDTNINYYQLTHIDFVNKLYGWVYLPNGFGFHTVTGGGTTIIQNVQQISSEVPTGFKLHQNYPNPFNPVTIINYELKNKSKVVLTVYDISGKQIKKLVNQEQQAGIYQYTFNAEGLSSGIYFYRLEIEGYIESKKMMIIR
jgi:photosystem II stability/assembly factor-like uncharacterized protein